MFTTIIIFVLLLSLLVLVHEFGHFICAIKSGTKVEEFGIGFPPRAWGKTFKGILFSINWIPLGGFVKIKGENGDDSRDKDSFPAKSMGARLLMISGGVIMNFIFAWFLLTIGYMVGMPQVVEGESSHRRVTQPKVHVYDVLENSPAAQAGLVAGDVIVAIDGEPMQRIDDVVAYTSEHDSQEVTLIYDAADKEKGRLAVMLTPTVLKETGRAGIGVSLFESGFVSYAWYAAPFEALRSTVEYTREIFSSLGGFFRDLFTERKVSADVSGPVGIAVITGEVARLGFRYLLQFAALLSLNLAVVNILPFPALDGGRLAFLVVEMIRRRRSNVKVETITHTVGFAFLMLVIIAVTYRDIVRYGGRIMKSLSALIGIG